MLMEASNRLIGTGHRNPQLPAALLAAKHGRLVYGKPIATRLTLPSIVWFPIDT